MSETITLADGHTVTFRDPQSVTRGQRLPMELADVAYSAAIAAEQEAKATGETPAPFDAEKAAARRVVTPEIADLYVALDAATILCFVESWSYDFPVDADGLNKLPAVVADQVSAKCRELRPSAFFSAPVDPSPDSPTEPSSV